VVDDPAVALSLGEALGLSEELAAALPPAYLVELPADAARLARAHPGVAFVSRAGVWATGGVVWVGGGQAGPGLLEREREVAELEAAIPRLETDLGAAVEQLEELVAERAERARESNRLEGELAQLRQELAVARARREDAEGRRRRLEGEHGEIADEGRQVAGEIERLAAAQHGLDAEITDAEARHAAVEARLDRRQADLDAAKAERERLREASAGRRGRLELLEERLDSHDREMARIGREIADGREQVTTWRDEAARLEGAGGDLEAAIDRAERELGEALAGRAEAEDAVLEKQQELDRHRHELREREARIAALRDERDGVRGRAGELKVERAGLDQDAEHLKTTFRDAFGEELGAAAEAASGEPPADKPAAPLAPPADLAALEADLARTKEALERLGPVNVLAVEEYSEQEERHGFLTTQRADVARSVDSLRKTIREINAASTERFAATFAAVNESFGRVFTKLFRGGEAEMRLLDEDDMLESGIEIVARPPGKRTQNIMLMSGGEKALTAIALLFALFETKPSPFCILDEVDAPLDDVNTLRFVELLSTMASDTQFIVITHNKLTMEAAGTLYGVTMEEKGVSKLVAVELDRVQPAEAAAATA
jgi:chromosome segregation protein